MGLRKRLRKSVKKVKKVATVVKKKASPVLAVLPKETLINAADVVTGGRVSSVIDTVQGAKKDYEKIIEEYTNDKKDSSNIVQYSNENVKDNKINQKKKGLIDWIFELLGI